MGQTSPVFNIHPYNHRQVYEGCMLGHSYTWNLNSSANKSEVLNWLFGDLNTAYLRTTMGETDTGSYYSGAIALNPDLKISANFWNGPGNDFSNTNLYEDWATELFDDLVKTKAAGMPVDTIDLFNEPDFGGFGRGNAANIIQNVVPMLRAMVADPTLNTNGVTMPRIMVPSGITPSGSAWYLTYFYPSMAAVWTNVDIVSTHLYTSSLSTSDLSTINNLRGGRPFMENEMHVAHGGDTDAVNPPESFVDNDLRWGLILGQFFPIAVNNGVSAYDYFFAVSPQSVATSLIYAPGGGAEATRRKVYYVLRQMSSMQTKGSSVVDSDIANGSTNHYQAIAYHNWGEEKAWVTIASPGSSRQSVTLKLYDQFGNPLAFNSIKTYETSSNYNAALVEEIALTTPSSQCSVFLPDHCVRTYEISWNGINQLLAGQNFKDGNFPGGGSGWSGNWTLVGSPYVFTNIFNHQTSACLQGNSGGVASMIRTLAQSLSGNGILRFKCVVDGLASGQTAQAQVYDGAWHSVWSATSANNGSYVGGYPDILAQASVGLQGYGPITQVKFQLNANNATNTFYVDNIEVVQANASSTNSAVASPPLAPVPLATALSSSQINLDWTATATAGATYTVSRSMTSGGPYTVIATGVIGTSLGDSGLTPLAPYYYVVKAVNASGEITGAEASAIPLFSGALPLDDAYVRDGSYATNNYGTDTVFTVKRDNSSYNRDSFLKFDVSGLANAPSIKIQLVPVGDSSGTMAFEFVANDSWTETGITWNTKPAGSSTVFTNIPTFSSGQPILVDVTSQAKAQAVGDGMLSMRIHENSWQQVISFASKENSDTSYRPQLIVLGVPVTPPAPTGLTATAFSSNQISLSWAASIGAASYNVKRSTNSGGPYTTIATGVTTTSYPDMGLSSGSTYYYVVSAVNSAGESANSSQTSATPLAWSNGDIGTVGAAGSASYSNGTHTVIGSGADIWGTADEFQYVYQTISGDCIIIARVTTLQNVNAWSKAGVMIRETLNANSAHAACVVTPGNGVAFQRRKTTGGTSINTNTTGFAAPYWVRIVRSGNTFTASRSPDGATWTTIASDTIAMNSNVYIGLAVSSHVDGTLCTATFDNVSVIAVPPPTLGGGVLLGGGQFRLTFSGTSGQSYSVLGSTNVALPLSSWTVLSSGTFGSGPVTYTNTAATNGMQFYLIRSP